MKRSPSIIAAWALAVAFAGGCGSNPTPPPSPDAEPAEAPGECEECQKLAKALPAKPATVPEADGLVRTPWLEPAARGGRSCRVIVSAIVGRLWSAP